MSLYIPAWVLWAVGLTIGVPLVLLIIAFAIFGYMAASAVGRPFR